MLRILLVSFAALALACSGQSGSSGVDLADSGDALGDSATLDARQDVTPDLGSDSDPECRTLGCPCEADLECESGYCVEHPDGGDVCSEFCLDDCSLEDYECVLLQNSGGDAVRICIPLGDSFCDPCQVSADCGSLRAACVPVVDGDRCITPCGAERTCPEGAVCEATVVEGDARDLCVPIDGVCEGCVDRDGDRYGLGPDCLGADPDDENPLTYPGAPETCDGVDNDGDGDVDEGFDFESDTGNCGSCGVRCDHEDGVGICSEGSCAIDSCDEGIGDCDRVFDNGCETDLTDPLRCGSCEFPSAEPGTVCGVCDTGIWTCEPDRFDVVCDRDRGDEAQNPCGGCELLDSAPGDRCGTCSAGVLECESPDLLACVDDPGSEAPDSCAVAQPLRIGWSVGNSATSEHNIRWSPDPVMAPYRTTDETRWSPVEDER